MPPRSFWKFETPPRLIFGRGARDQLFSESRASGWKQWFVVTDQRLFQSPLVNAFLREASSAFDVQVFGEGVPEPAIEIALKAVQAAREAAPDVVIGLGGGSNMDLAKIVAMLLTHPGEARQYFGFGNVPGPIMPLVCLPTTAGTGSEVSHAAVLTDTQSAIKVSTLSPFLRPRLAIVDPAFTDTCPPNVTADSGIDALVHAIEAYTARDFSELNTQETGPVGYEGAHPIGDIFAKRAIELITANLLKAIRTPNDQTARDGMALAATLAGMSFSNCGVALVHALEYPIGAAVHCSHGAGNGMLLPAVMKFNLPVRAARIADIGAWMGVPREGRSTEELASLAIDAVDRLCREAGIPARIRDLGACREQLPEFAAKSHQITRLRYVNPREATSQDLLNILESVY